jgi:hypothetical protein
VSRKPAHARHRTDTGSAHLVELIRALGAEYEPLGGPLDGAMWVGDQVALVDFKATEKAPLTPRQGRLVARGMPIHFLWEIGHVNLLVQRLKRRAADTETR